MKTGKTGKFRIGPPECIAFLGPQAEQKKTNCKKKFLMSLPLLESKRIFLFNHWSRYERSREVTIWNDFQS